MVLGSTCRFATPVARIASVPTSIDQRAQLLLEPLGRVVPFQGAWISLLDPEAAEQPPLVCHGYPSGLRSYMAGPAGVAEIEMLGLNRSGATRLSDLRIDLQQVRSWAEYLAPAGFRGGLVAGLFTRDGRYLGMLGLNTDTAEHPTEAARDLIGADGLMDLDFIDGPKYANDVVRTGPGGKTGKKLQWDLNQNGRIDREERTITEQELYAATTQ